VVTAVDDDDVNDPASELALTSVMLVPEDEQEVALDRRTRELLVEVCEQGPSASSAPSTANSFLKMRALASA